MAESGFVDLPDTCTVAEALRKYSAHKAWCTRYTNEIKKAQPLLDRQYDRRTDELHARAAAAAAQSPAAARRPPPVQDSQSVKLVSELKPDT